MKTFWHNERLNLKPETPQEKQWLMSLWKMLGSQVLNLGHSVDAGITVDSNDENSVVAVHVGL